MRKVKTKIKGLYILEPRISEKDQDNVNFKRFR